MKKQKIITLTVIFLLGVAGLIGSARYPREYRIAAVGDIARRGGEHARTAALVSALDPKMVLVLGDNVYESGTQAEFAELYDPTWGIFKAITAPTPGNHEYETPGARGYYDYFGSRAGPDSRGYYSFDLGSWHIISLNSEVLDIAQLAWLESDLNQSGKACILAYWHKPLFSSGKVHGNNLRMKPFWDRLYAYGADVVLNGHEHVYERFAKQNPDEIADPRGIREFIVGTGGADQYAFRTISRPNSEIRSFDEYGVLSITLKKASYSAEFVPAQGSTFVDKVDEVPCN